MHRSSRVKRASSINSNAWKAKNVSRISQLIRRRVVPDDGLAEIAPEGHDTCVPLMGANDLCNVLQGPLVFSLVRRL